MTKYREEHANVLVAQALNWLLGGNLVKSETKGRRDRKLLDLEFNSPEGIKIFIEAKYDNRQAAADAAAGRLNLDSPPDVAGALSYSSAFEKDAARAISDDAPIDFAFKSRDDVRNEWRWRRGTIYDLAQSLRRARTIVSPREDEVKNAVARIQGALAQFASGFIHKPACIGRMADDLQINLDDDNDDEKSSETIRVGGLILLGAFLFQFALSEKEKRVKSPSNFKGISEIQAHWQYILDEINYVAVFEIAKRVLVSGNVSLREAETLIAAAQEVQATARGGVDLIGRIFHTLLPDAKTLAAYYTSIPAATMMAGIALSPRLWGGIERWGSRDFIRNFRIADLACGSGTLLAAACWQIRDNFARADFRARGGRFGGDSELGENLRQVHRDLMENSVWGYDILETAAHLTAATLGLISPEVDFKKAHIYRSIIGKTDFGVATGSLDLLESARPHLTAKSEQVETKKEADPLPELDLCIMNPPFVRGSKDHEMFGFLPAEERDLVHKRLRELSRSEKWDFVQDGQGPAFVALACKNYRNEVGARAQTVKEGGRLALVLPASFAVGMGKAWRGAREKIERDFDLETLIVSREHECPNFSDSTNLQECICIARKRRAGEEPSSDAMVVVLSRNPRTGEDARATAQAILEARANGQKIGDLQTADSGLLADNIGQFAILPYRGKSAWRGISFANLHLALAAESLEANGKFGALVESKNAVPLKALDSIAELGGNRLHKYESDPNPKMRRVEISKTSTPFVGYYPGHHKRRAGVSQKDIADIAESPHCFLMPLPGREEWAQNYFSNGGRIVLNESFRFNTVRRIASLVAQRVQAAHYWPIRLRVETESRAKAMTLWLNSTPAILLIAHLAGSTHGAKATFSQAAAAKMPVLDLDALSDSQIAGLTAVFDEIVALTAHGEGLLPLPQMETDPTRAKLDTAISNALGVGDFRHLRAALAREPIITGRQQSVD